MADKIDVKQGTLALMILRTLDVLGPLHGYGVARWVEVATGDALAVGEGTLYPALHRLEERGLVSASWGASENNRRAKFYRLTKAGEREFEAQASGWLRLSNAVSRAVTSTDLP